MSDQHFSQSGCPLAETLSRDPVPLFSNGELNFKAHDVGWLVAGLFSIIASWASIWLILKHLSFFYHPSEQRMIVRILFMPVIYAWCSFFSYYFVHQALYWQLGRDCYEAIIIGSFFYLLLSYLSNPRPSREEPFPRPYKTQAERTAQLRATVKNVHVKKWVWPLGSVKWRPGRKGGRGEPASGEGEAFLWWMRVFVGQYVVIRPLTTLASVIAEANDYYCLASWSPKFVHVYSSAIITISVTVAMYAVVQLYVVLAEELEPYSPILKFLAVKLVVFFTFWQESSLGLLVTVGVIKNRTYYSAEDIVIGLSALLSCFEMVIFSFMHVRAFSYLPYRALASPVLVDSQLDPAADSQSDHLESSTPSRQLTFAEWSEWDKSVKDREKEQARLAKKKLPKQIGNLPVLKPDGSPILQQTKKWPAFVKCIKITDLLRELREETKWVARGGKVEMTQELLETDRRDDHEMMMGVARPRIERGHRTGGGAAVDLDEELRKLRDSRPVSLRSTTIDRNGNRVLRKGGKHAWSREEDRVTDAKEEGDGVELRRELREGWWSERMNSLGRQQVISTPRRHLDSDYSPRDIPFMSNDSSILLPPPHQLRSAPVTMRSPEARPPPPISLLPCRERPVDIELRRHSRRGSEPSQDSVGHLPRTTLRPPSFLPPSQTLSPSPPPFSQLHLPHVSPLDELPTSSVDAIRAGEAHRTSTPLLPPPPPAAFFSAGTASSNSRGLPLGAAPPRLS